MTIALWIVSGVLAALYLVAGVRKLAQSKDQIVVQPGMGWAEEYAPRTLRLIGGAEVAGALGLILPAATGVAPWLTPVAALALAVLQALAIRMHLRRGERAPLPFNVVLLVLALVVVAGRLAT
jgi:uncharacterized membrane protein